MSDGDKLVRDAGYKLQDRIWALEGFFENIDYPLLRKQKNALVKAVMAKAAHNELTSRGQNQVATVRVEVLDGVIAILDTLQDVANDVMNLEDVFEEEDE